MFRSPNVFVHFWVWQGCSNGCNFASEIKNNTNMKAIVVIFFVALLPFWASYNPQNEMFLPLKTRRSLLKNETFTKSQFFKKNRPGFAGDGFAPAQNIIMASEHCPKAILFSLYALGRCATAFSLMLPRSTLYTRSRFAL